MSENKKVIVIPATKSLHPERDGVAPIRNKKRVAAYCRVSTAMEEQLGSYENQLEYYEKFISGNPNWEPVGVYGDEGKSGTSLKGRTGFLEMMDDVRAGKIDMIVTKATSRFGRNGIDFMEMIDEIGSYGVEVMFESEGIVTYGTENRVMLQMMGASNEHYSSSLSKNIRWSKERSMRKGQVVICYKHFLGYEKGPDGNPKIVPEEAETVRMIYDLFLEGNNYTQIARILTNKKRLTATGKTTWNSLGVKSILTNEKYTGDALLQKTFRRSYLDKKCYKNNGERPQIRVENNHEAIIDKPTFARVQEIIESRHARYAPRKDKSPFIGKLVCADCGQYFGHKTWHSRGNIKYAMWVCNNKYTEETSYGGKKCKSLNLRQEWLEEGYLHSMQQIIARKTKILAKCERNLARVNTQLESGKIEKELIDQAELSKSIDVKKDELRDEYELSIGKSDYYEGKMRELELQGEDTLKRTKELEDKRKELNAKKQLLESYINTITHLPDKVERFNTELFMKTIDHVKVSQFILSYYFLDGECVKVNIELIKKLCKNK